MKTRNSIIGLALIGLMASCSGTKVVSDMDKSTNFTNYNTYQLKPHEGDEKESAILLNELNEKRIVSAIERQLTASGMEASDNPDAYVVYGVGIDIQKGYTTSTHYAGGPYGYGRRGPFYGGGFGSSYSTTTETQTANSTISIALIDAETDELLWISHGTKEIKPNSKKVEENINKSVARIFEDIK